MEMILIRFVLILDTILIVFLFHENDVATEIIQDLIIDIARLKLKIKQLNEGLNGEERDDRDG